MTFFGLTAAMAESFSGTRLGLLSPFLVEKHKQARIQAGPRVRANRELAVLKALFKGDNPLTTVKFLKEPQQRLRFLEPAEEGRLLDAARDPLRSIILVGIHCDLRLRSAAVTLRWRDVGAARRTVTVQGRLCEERPDPLGPVELHDPGRTRMAPEDRRVCV